MHAVQENEFGQLRELTSFLDVETNYVQSYLDVLKDVKAEWQQMYVTYAEPFHALTNFVSSQH